ncbi:MAG: DEAD/DEAH box helicase [Desulfobacterales bacterium]|nr:DEAD/DEAH box helicase [Desulfobacterales bacterium]
MHPEANIDEYIEALRASRRMRHQVVYHREIPQKPPDYVTDKSAFSQGIRQMLSALDIDALYTHQYNAVNEIRNGRHTVISTPTASGKTLIYNLPVIERIQANPKSRAIYLFPLKALAQDQLRTFEAMAAHFDENPPRAAIYDGDTSAWHRKKIRSNLPNVILTNPEMLHLAFLPYHDKWADLFANLETVVVDEVHTYRGVMGSHMAQIFKRFRRVCEKYGSRPTFVFSSATIANPAELCESLTGMPVVTESRSGAPRGKRHLVFLNPDASPSNAAIMLLKAALHRGLRTIVYTQSRKMTELISVWAGSRSGQFAGKISAYRAGFLPGQRREIEQKLVSGELLAVISTSALELGIDIGDLDLCLLVGYPGTIMSTWQRGGRVGRTGDDSAMVLIAGEDALDQYIMRHPAAFFEKGPESAVINPYNPDILKKHLLCAAAELPLDTRDEWLKVGPVRRSAEKLEQNGQLLKSAKGDCYFSALKSPHRFVDLRGGGDQFSIIESSTGENLGDIDGFRAFRETHPGAIYLHMGQTFRVEKLDISTMTVSVTPARPTYYTRVRADKQTEILDVYSEKAVYGTRIFFGRLKVTDKVTGYEKWHLHSKKRMNIIDLDLPPQIFETDGLWFQIPPPVQAAVEKAQMHFMGGIHAVEHAAIGICPLLILTDRNDLGGISIPFHPQVGCAAVFIYDGIPGGIGLTRQAYARAEDLMDHTYQVINTCDCEAGCPSCVHSPKCGSGNRPIDKLAALSVLDKLVDPETPLTPAGDAGTDTTPNQTAAKPAEKDAEKEIYYGVLDLETQRSADEVGGWHRSHKMGLSCVVLYDSKTGQYHNYYESDVPALIAHMQQMALIIGFNIKRFDYQVLSGYSDFDFSCLNTLDMLEVIYQRLGYRLSLNHLAKVSLGIEKSADGLQALKWWKEGRLDDIVEYCRIDVQITHEVYLYGRKNGYLLFQNKAGQAVRIPVDW